MTADLEAYHEFVDILGELDDEMRWEFIIDMAKRHKKDPFPESAMSDENLMHGCMSKVWILHDREIDKHYFRGHSDSIIVKGLVSMMAESFSGLRGAELQALTLDHVRDLNLGALTTQRQVGMMAMLKHMQRLGRQTAATSVAGEDVIRS